MFYMNPGGREIQYGGYFRYIVANHSADYAPSVRFSVGGVVAGTSIAKL